MKKSFKRKTAETFLFAGVIILLMTVNLVLARADGKVLSNNPVCTATMTFSSPIIKADGKSTADICVRGFDINGKMVAMADDTVITFQTTIGIISDICIKNGEGHATLTSAVLAEAQKAMIKAEIWSTNKYYNGLAVAASVLMDPQYNSRTDSSSDANSETAIGDPVKTPEGYYYIVLMDGDVAIQGYDGIASDLVIPDKLLLSIRYQFLR